VLAQAELSGTQDVLKALQFAFVPPPDPWQSQLQGVVAMPSPLKTLGGIPKQRFGFVMSSEANDAPLAVPQAPFISIPPPVQRVQDE
jgi:hypothetical protein